MRTTVFCASVFAILASSQVPAQEATAQADRVSFEHDIGEVLLKIDGKPIATYVYEDPEIPRPYFAHVKTLDGIQVTRNHPPQPGTDRSDHKTMLAIAVRRTGQALMNASADGGPSSAPRLSPGVSFNE